MKKLLPLLLAVLTALCLGGGALALDMEDPYLSSAEALHDLGLFQGTGTNADRGILATDLNSDGRYKDILYVDGGTSTGTTSSANTPLPQDAAARWWLRSAKASASSRVMP